MKRSASSLRARAVFGTPLLVGVAALAGLVLGLVGDGWWDAAAWLLVGLMPATLLYAWMTRRV